MYAAQEESQSTPVPKGLVALSTLMTTTHKHLVGPSCFESANGELGSMIGFGTFAVVHCHTTEDAHVIKLSRYGARSLLENEVSVLKELQTLSAPDIAPGIAQFVGYNKSLKVNVGGVDVNLPALTTKPRGVRIEMAVGLLANDIKGGKHKFMTKIGGQSSSALKFIHDKGFRHNDVSPKNIMFDRTKDSAFLIDFGLASKSDENIKSFRGTARYAHRSIFRKYPQEKWISEPSFDNTSLAFSMAGLLNGGKSLWNSFQQFTINEEKPAQTKFFTAWADNRSNVAWSRLQLAGFTDEWKRWCGDSDN
jgi:hypothetical protein